LLGLKIKEIVISLEYQRINRWSHRGILHRPLIPFGDTTKHFSNIKIFLKLISRRLKLASKKWCGEVGLVKFVWFVGLFSNFFLLLDLTTVFLEENLYYAII
jgi:hypothetical protein